MTTSGKIKFILIVSLLAIFIVIAGRHFVGLHFKKKFSVRPAPGVIVYEVEKSTFYKSIETFGTAIAQNSKTYRVKKELLNKKFNFNNKFVKKGQTIVELNDGEKIIAEFDCKIGKREIAQGVLGTDSILLLWMIKKSCHRYKVPENYVGVIKTGLKAEIYSSAFNKNFKGKMTQ